jgi:hypothetical protein
VAQNGYRFLQQKTFARFKFQACAPQSLQHESQTYKMIVDGLAKNNYIVDICQANIKRQTGQHHINDALESCACIT